jgi:hypothetical protein
MLRLFWLLFVKIMGGLVKYIVCCYMYHMMHNKQQLLHHFEISFDACFVATTVNNVCFGAAMLNRIKCLIRSEPGERQA